MAYLQRTRSSSPSTLSCITVRDEDGETSYTKYSTPPTSNPDATSPPTEHEGFVTLARSKDRPLRAGRSIKSYNENILAGTAKKSGSRRITKNRNASSEASQERDRIVSASSGTTSSGRSNTGAIVLTASDVVSMGKSVNAPSINGLGRRRSNRLNLIGNASEIFDPVKISKVSTVEEKEKILGKRKAMAADGNKSQIFQSHTQLKRNGHGSTSEAHTVKRTRLSKDLPTETAPKEKLSSTNINPPKVKRWLSCGLYVGQESYPSSRLTSARRRAKSTIDCSSPSSRKYLPLPMFTGNRVIHNGRDFKLPFDIFSPLPPGQPKPEEWRKTRKNVFIGEASSIWKKNKIEELSRCICTPETGCGERCQNRFMFYECDETNCNIGTEHCTNRNFQALKQRCKAGGKYNIGVEVIKTADRGYGVRTNRTFEPNQIIVEYAGEIITQEECEKRMKTVYKNNECYYLMLFDQNMIIDASRGSIARFVNHSCQPNCSMVKWTVAGKPRMALFAGERGVMTGEELTYDYNFDPFSVKNVQACRCGASNCRGFLGPKSKEQPKSKTAKSGLKPTVTGAKRKLQDTIALTGKVSQKQPKKRKVASHKNDTKTALGNSPGRPRKRVVEKSIRFSNCEKSSKKKKSTSSKSRDKPSRSRLAPNPKTSNVSKRRTLASNRAERSASKTASAKRDVGSRTIRGKAANKVSRT